MKYYNELNCACIVALVVHIHALWIQRRNIALYVLNHLFYTMWGIFSAAMHTFPKRIYR